MELSVSSETTFFNMKLQLEICPQLRTGSSAEDTGRIDTSINWQHLYNFKNGSILPLHSLGNLMSSSPQFLQKISDYEMAHCYHVMFLLQVC